MLYAILARKDTTALEEQLATFLALQQSIAHMPEPSLVILVLCVLLALLQVLQITTAADVRPAIWRLEALLASSVRQDIWELQGQLHLAAALSALQAIILSMDIHTAQLAELDITARLLDRLPISHAQQEPIRQEEPILRALQPQLEIIGLQLITQALLVL